LPDSDIAAVTGNMQLMLFLLSEGCSCYFIGAVMHINSISSYFKLSGCPAKCFGPG